MKTYPRSEAPDPCEGARPPSLLATAARGSKCSNDPSRFGRAQLCARTLLVSPRTVAPVGSVCRSASGRSRHARSAALQGPDRAEARLGFYTPPLTCPSVSAPTATLPENHDGRVAIDPGGAWLLAPTNAVGPIPAEACTAFCLRERRRRGHGGAPDEGHQDGEEEQRQTHAVILCRRGRGGGVTD